MLRRIRGRDSNFPHVQLSPVAPCRGSSFFLILELKSVCKMNSHQAPRIPRPMVWLVGTHNAKHRFRGRELLVLSDLPQNHQRHSKQVEMAGGQE